MLEVVMNSIHGANHPRSTYHYCTYHCCGKVGHPQKVCESTMAVVNSSSLAESAVVTFSHSTDSTKKIATSHILDLATPRT